MTKIRQNKDSYLYIRHKKILIDASAVGGGEFLSVVSKYARNAEHTTAKDEKLFNGNIKNPKEILAVSLFFPVLTMAMMIWAGFALPAVSLEKMEHSTLKLMDYDEEQDADGQMRFCLLPEDPENDFVIYEEIDKDSLIQDIKNQEIFDIYYLNSEYQTKIVRQISSDTKMYLSADAFIQERTKTRIELFSIFSGILLLELLFLLLQNHILSHAERYPNAVKFFVREDYLVKK